MAYFEGYRFPDDIAQGATGGPVFKTTSTKSASGMRQTNRDWANALHRYQVSHAIKTLERFKRLRAFFYTVGGSADSFPFRDYSNYRVAQTEGVLQLLGGSDYQLHQAQVYGPRTYFRRIRKPLNGTVSVWRTRAGSTTQIAPTIDYATGQVAMSGHQSGDTYAWAGWFDVPVYFMDDTMANARWIGPANGMYMEWPSIELEEDRLA